MLATLQMCIYVICLLPGFIPVRFGVPMTHVTNLPCTIAPYGIRVHIAIYHNQSPRKLGH